MTAPHTRASNDAFGQTSPHWNLPFHAGRITAAEILAYFPHWLKSVDAIDRFVMNGGKAKIISGMLNRFRNVRSAPISTNSICVMMQCAMRAAGWKNWKMTTHDQVYNAVRENDFDGASLDVTQFRTPMVTHPKKGSKAIENFAAAPIEFRDLADEVKEHPSGSDALDITRCVLYAVNHPNESWRFPVDFERLVNRLGGPQTPTHHHLDTQAFGRCLTEVLDPEAHKRLSVTPLINSVTLNTTATMVSTRSSQIRPATQKNRAHDEIDSARADNLNGDRKRRSGRIATQGFKTMYESDSDVAATYQNTDPYEPAQKKRKFGRASPVDSDFMGTYTSDSDSLRNATDDVSDELLSLERKRPVRASAQKARRLTQKAVRKETLKTRRAAQGMMQPTPFDNYMSAPTAPTHAPTIPDNLIDPVLLGYARDLEARAPVKAFAPPLNPDRPMVDEYNVYLYAEYGCITREQMWASAMSSQRFNNGPRSQAPFRELYRLSNPMPWDISDWAENIRWAKEQWLHFGVESWTEYDDHLEQIIQLRRQTMWVSEEAISGGGIYHY